MNAVSLVEVAALRELFLASYEDDEVRCVVVTGNGRAFCAGRDLADAQPNEDGEALLSEHINPMLLSLHNHPKPTIAAVNGAAMGIGLGLALACDIVVAGESAVFAAPFAKLGGALDTGGHYYLPQRLSLGRVFEMIYTARNVGGAEAARLGLADRVTPDGVLQSTVAALASQIAAGPQAAFRGQKSILRRLGTLSLVDVLAEEARLQGSLSSTPEYLEGIRAFREKRPADFRAAIAGGKL
jgi:2-(1,2-epoxy-1,2-dihydrophenyl)acetyl-CoA isomerase